MATWLSQGATRRADPAPVGLPAGGTRRVAGLRRDEVAALTAISVDYYTRHQQRHGRSPDHGLGAIPAEQRYFIRLLFMNPVMRALYADW